MCKRNMDRLPLTGPHLETCPATQACALTGNRTGDLSVHRPAHNPLSPTSQGTDHILVPRTAAQETPIDNADLIGSQMDLLEMNRDVTKMDM